MCVVAYVSGHGLGHSAREVEILRRLPEEIPLIVVTSASTWFWEQEMTRKFTLREDSFDVGCLQTTSLDVDQVATKAAFLTVQAHNLQRKESEKAWLEEVKARLVLTDVASFPLTLARELAIPSFCVANFTWADIYSEYAGFEEIVEGLKSEYSATECLWETDLSLPMLYFSQRESMGLVARLGVSRREELPNFHQKLALISAGNWGLPFPWSKLATFSAWHFLTLTPPPFVVQNLTVLDRKAMPHPDIVASVDLVISKLGYGILGECLANATPILYPPREFFAEFAAMEKAIRGWQGRLALDSEAFLGLEWAEMLERVPKRGTFPPSLRREGRISREK